MWPMDPTPPVVMSFPTLDEAESALDWIGVDFVDADRGFEGELVPDDREILDKTLADPDAPAPVKALARRFCEVLEAPGHAGGAAWRVAFEA